MPGAQEKAPPGWTGRGLLIALGWGGQASFFRPRRLRATRVAAAAPNSRIIGGAGTGVPPDELDEEPPLEELELLLELDELLLDEEELEPLVLPEPPKLLDPPLAPELVEVDAPELVEEVELDAPDEVELPWLDDPDEP
ncbi:MAG: hypothetical protein QOD42_2581 [Sphingomonadales bacterium]|jgi:hypothetical protein|nr:hypothetical protein [Sphingomonadales bacterium]